MHRHAGQMLMELQYWRQIFEKPPNSKFHEIHPVETELIHTDSNVGGRTDRQIHDEAKSRYSQFRESV